MQPKRDMLVTALLSILLVMLPLFGVLYWFGSEHGAVPLVLAAHVAVVLGALGMLLRQLSVDTVVTETELRGRGIFSPLVRVPLDRIASVHLVPTFIGQQPEPVQQLLIRDASGRRLYRMRGNFWPAGDLEQVAAALPVPAVTVREPMTMPEFFAAYPGSAYWFENRPWLVPAVIVVGGLLVLALSYLGMRALGMPAPF